MIDLRLGDYQANATHRLAFPILGEPIGKGRPRFGQGRTFTPSSTREYEHIVSELAAVHGIAQGWPRGFAGLCAVDITAVFSRPRTRWRKKDPDQRIPRERGRVDVDNCAKAILDGLQAGRVFQNDSQVVDLRVRLLWCALDEAPCVEVEVTTLDAAEEIS
jgi:Holliday junction resolvase RusA-like endonuclease